MSGRNFDGVQFQALRVKLDTVVNNLHDNLSDCYYNHWKLGNSKAFFIWDKRPNAAATKLQFDLLQGLIFHIYQIVFHKLNKLDPEADYPEDKYNNIYDAEGNLIGTRAQESRDWITSTAATYSVNIAPIRDHVINWIQTQLGRTVDLS